jgi:2-oxoglutarate dehydrogenase complex dehydrogenase (E1) component-like enzyme
VTNISDYINEHFGANASYVEGLMARYKADAKSVDESWQIFFSDLLNEASPLDKITQTTTITATSTNESADSSAKEKAAIALGSDIDYRPITGSSNR